MGARLDFCVFSMLDCLHLCANGGARNGTLPKLKKQNDSEMKTYVHCHVVMVDTTLQVLSYFHNTTAVSHSFSQLTLWLRVRT